MTSRSLRSASTLALLATASAAGFLALSAGILQNPKASLIPASFPPSSRDALAALNAAFELSWQDAGVEATPAVSDHTAARRLSLALTGAPPSLQELRGLEALPEDADPIPPWLEHLFSDSRYHDYIAERLARAYVGTESGPFLVYRRRRLVDWIAGQLAMNRPYDEMTRDLIAADGIWTSNPPVNFVTVSIVPEDGDNKPDEVTLAARTSRAFLGISLDCVQCHDDKFSDDWKQEDFHGLAAFYGQAEMGITGIRERISRGYEARLSGQTEEQAVLPAVPYRPDLLPEEGNRRERLAEWITHKENRAFARAAVNRTWGLLFGRPLVDPVDDIPLQGPYPPGLEELTDAFLDSDYDLRSLIRLIAASAPFRRESRSALPREPVTPEQEAEWAAFPVTPLRPEQVAGSIIQAASLRSLDRSSHFLHRLRRFGEMNDFVKRYGDPGESEFQEEAGTIPQRLLLMNGNLVTERTKPNVLLNAATRVSRYATGDEEAVEAAFLATLTRLPSETEREHFARELALAEGKRRDKAMQDLYWALMNSTEFSWNR